MYLPSSIKIFISVTLFTCFCASLSSGRYVCVESRLELIGIARTCPSFVPNRLFGPFFVWHAESLLHL